VSLSRTSAPVGSSPLVEGGFRVDGGHLKQSQPGRPLISVVTVVRNGQQTIERTIQSVLAQSYPNIEYIVVDGASDDGTLDILRRYGERIDYWISEPDGGIYEAMNNGIKLCTGQAIGLLNCGDYYEPDFVERLLKVLPEGQDVSDIVLYSDFSVIYEDVALCQKIRSTMRIWGGMSICHQAMLIGRSVYESAGLYDSDFRLAGDYEYLLRMACRGTRFVHVPYYGVNFVDGGASLLMRRRSLQEAAVASKRHFGAYSPQHIRFLVCYYYWNLFVYVYAKNTVAAIFGKSIVDRVKSVKLKLTSNTTAIGRQRSNTKDLR